MSLSYSLGMNKTLYNEIISKICIIDYGNSLDSIFKNFQYYYQDDVKYSRTIFIIKYQMIRDDIEDIRSILIGILPRDIVNLIEPMCLETYYIESVDGYCESCENDKMYFEEAESYSCCDFRDHIEDFINRMTLHICEDELHDYLYKQIITLNVNELSFKNE